MNRKLVKVIAVDRDSITFEGDITLRSDHEQDCCEEHYLDMSNLSMEDFNGLLFDIENDTFLERVKDFGIALIPLNGHPVRIPGYGYNNGYYSSDMDLILEGKGFYKTYNITECQSWESD